MLKTEDALYEAIESGIIRDYEAAEYIKYEYCYPLNWSNYVPPKMSRTDSIRFVLALMRYHMSDDTEPFEICMRQLLYLPKTGEQYKIMLGHINACNNQSRPSDSASSISFDDESTDDCGRYICSLAWSHIPVSKLKKS